MNNNKWAVYACCMLYLNMAEATQIKSKEMMLTPFDHQAQSSTYKQSAVNYNVLDFKFDSARLLSQDHQTNTYGADLNHFQLNQKPSSGFFIYKMDSELSSQLRQLSLPVPDSGKSMYSNSIYAHLITRFMQHLFFDLAGGYGQNHLGYNSGVNLNYWGRNGYSSALSKNWYASASALFTHTWKEFVFNANLQALHGDLEQDAYTLNFMANPASQVSSKLNNNVSYLEENAEISYKVNDRVQPFIGGGFLQVFDLNSHQTVSPLFSSAISDYNLDMNGYKLGGGLAFNYKQYVFRLEQQYFQRGNIYHGNQSTLSVKMNIG